MQIPQPNTFFFVQCSLAGKEYILGPYYDIQHATMILVDFVPEYVRILNNSSLSTFKYKAEIHEKTLKMNEWKTVSIPVTESGGCL